MGSVVLLSSIYQVTEVGPLAISLHNFLELHVHEQGRDGRGSALALMFLPIQQSAQPQCHTQSLMLADYRAGLCVFKDGAVTSQVPQSELIEEDEMVEERFIR